MGRKRSVQGQPAVAMIRPSTELIACCAVVSAYMVRSACVTVTPTVSNETSALSGSMADAICSAAGQCGCSAALSGQLAHWLNFKSVQNGGAEAEVQRLLRSIGQIEAIADAVRIVHATSR